MAKAVKSGNIEVLESLSDDEIRVIVRFSPEIPDASVVDFSHTMMI